MAHMAFSTSYLDHAQPYTSHNMVVFGNGNVLPVSHIGTAHIPPNIHLKNTLVVPYLSKKMLYVSQLTNVYPIDVLFSRTFSIFRTE